MAGIFIPFQSFFSLRRVFPSICQLERVSLPPLPIILCHIIDKCFAVNEFTKFNFKISK